MVALNVGGSGALEGAEEGEEEEQREDGLEEADGAAQWSERAPSGGEDMMVLYGDSDGDDGEAEEDEIDGGHFDAEPSSPDRPVETHSQDDAPEEDEDDLMITPSSPLPSRSPSPTSDHDRDLGEEEQEEYYQDTSAFSPPRSSPPHDPEDSEENLEEQLARQQIEALAAQLVAMDEARRFGGGGGEVRVGPPFEQVQEQVTADYDAGEQEMDYEALYGGLDVAGQVEEQAHDDGGQVARDNEDDLIITEEYFQMPMDTPAMPQLAEEQPQGHVVAAQEVDMFIPPSLDTSFPIAPIEHGLPLSTSPPFPPLRSTADFLAPPFPHLPQFDPTLPTATEGETLADLLAISTAVAIEQEHSREPEQEQAEEELAPVDLTSSSPVPQSPTVAAADEGEEADEPQRIDAWTFPAAAPHTLPQSNADLEPHTTFTGIFSSIPAEAPIPLPTPTEEEAPVLPRGRRIAEGRRMARRPEGAGAMRSVLAGDEGEEEETGDLLGVGDYGSDSQSEGGSGDEGAEGTKEMEEVVLSDSDEDEVGEGETQQEDNKAPSSEPMSYDSRDEDEMEQDEVSCSLVVGGRGADLSGLQLISEDAAPSPAVEDTVKPNDAATPSSLVAVESTTPVESPSPPAPDEFHQPIDDAPSSPAPIESDAALDVPSPPAAIEVSPAEAPSPPTAPESITLVDDAAPITPVVVRATTPAEDAAPSSPVADSSTTPTDSASPPRVRNVEQPGAWDPSTPIRFGPSTATEGVDTLEEALGEAMEDVQVEVEQTVEEVGDESVEIEVEMDVEVLEGDEMVQADEVSFWLWPEPGSLC